MVQKYRITLRAATQVVAEILIEDAESLDEAVTIAVASKDLQWVIDPTADYELESVEAVQE